MHLAFDIFQGIGIAAAIGIRPFLPSLAAGALAAGDVEIQFTHTSYAFLQDVPFLLVMVILTAAWVTVDRGPWELSFERGPLGGVIILVSLALGALFFAGSLAHGGHAAWPGYVGGVVCTAIGVVASRPFLTRVRSRLDAASAAIGLPVIADGSAVLAAVLSVVAPPVGVLVLLGLLWLAYRGRQGEDRKYAGLRILR